MIYICKLHWNQCSDPALNGWKWGQNMWDIIKHRSDLSGMTDNSTVYNTLGFHALTEIPAAKLECFEDIYFSARSVFCRLLRT